MSNLDFHFNPLHSEASTGIVFGLAKPGFVERQRVDGQPAKRIHQHASTHTVVMCLGYSILRQSATLVALMIFGSDASAQWVAYNDHATGEETHPHATRYHILGEGDGTNGPLRNVFTGDSLTVTMQISHTGFVLAEQSGTNPPPDTPLHRTFAGFVDFAGAPAPNVAFTASGEVIYTLAGLDSSKRYVLAAGAIRGGDAAFSNRWTLVELVGAESFVRQHSAGVLDASSVSELGANQAAINLGRNHTPDSGDLVEWASIDPGLDGRLQLRCAKYGGSVPGGSSSGFAVYALTGLRLHEYVEDVQPKILQSPTNQVVKAGQPATFSVVADYLAGQAQWYRDGEAIPDANGSSYTLFPTARADSGSRFHVVLSNNHGVATSEEALLVVSWPAWSPLAFDHGWKYEASGQDLGTVWRAPEYDDSSWPSGPGPLGFESDPLPEPIRTFFPNAGARTYYFRTTFVVTNEVIHHRIQVRHLLDDGAVFYLNGTEWFRVNMPGGPVDAWTLASPFAVTDAVIEAVEFDDVSLPPGTNSLVVEVHQITADSSDLVFGVSMRADPADASPLSIIRHPMDQAAAPSQRVTFSVEVAGIDASYQWFKDGEPLPGARASSLVIPSASSSDEGSYTVAVSNVWSLVVSQPAMLKLGETIPLEILNQPTNQTAFIGEQVEFIVEVRGDAPYAVQWFKDDRALAGATNISLTLDQVHLLDSGIYAVGVTNSFSRIMGHPFTLEVRRHPRGEPGTPHRDFAQEPYIQGAFIRNIVRQQDGRLLLGGDFDGVDDMPKANVVRISQDGVLDPSFAPAATDNGLFMIEILSDGKILIGGLFSEVNNVPRSSLARLHADGTLDMGFDPDEMALDSVRDIAERSDGKIIVVGEFYEGDLFGASGLYCYHPDGTLDFAVIEEDSTFYAVAAQADRKILVGKTFNSSLAPERSALVRFHPDGRLDESFKPVFAGEGLIFEIEMDRGKMVVSGIFDSVNGLSRAGLVRLHLDGSVDSSFVPPELQFQNLSRAVNDFAIQPSGRMVIAGNFIATDGLPQIGLAALFPNGTLDPRLNDGTTDFGVPRSVAVDLNGDVYAVRPGIIKLYGTGEFNLDWRKPSEGGLEILWPGDREDLILESAEGLEGRPWSLVTEPIHQVEKLNASMISPSAPERIFRLRRPQEE